MRIRMNGWAFTRAIVICFYALLVAGCCQIQAIRTESLPDATVGQPYSFTLDHNCSGKSSAEAADWQLVTAAALPPGLSLSREGRLSGTPIAPGTYSFAIQLGASTLSTFDIQDVRTLSMIVRAESAAMLGRVQVATLTGHRTTGCI